MKILYIADSTSIHTQRWLRFFLQRGDNVSIITIGKKRQVIPGAEHLENFDRFYYDSASFLPVWLKARKTVRQARPDILHGHFIHQYGWLAALCHFHPLVLTAWGSDVLSLPHESRSGIGRRMTRYALQQADLITGTSEHLRTEMIRLGAAKEKIEVIHWGVDLDRFRADVDSTAIRRQLEIGDRPVVLSNRLHASLYNNDVIIRAMALVLKTIPEAVLVLQNASGSPDKELIGLAEELGIGPSTRFLPQFPHDQLPALYAMAHVYVSVPSWDGGPVSPIEAMACGAVPVVSALPGPMEWIHDGLNGRVVPVRSIDETAAAILDLLRDGAKREKFRQINVKLVKEKGNHRASMKRVEELYERLLRGRSR
jgi:glycosyltransferase involved in cell wall biosynthesis